MSVCKEEKSLAELLHHSECPTSEAAKCRGR